MGAEKIDVMAGHYASMVEARAAVAELVQTVQSIAADCRRGAHEYGMTPAGVRAIAARCDAALAKFGAQP